ncbi:glycosyltransferase family 4 protein [Tepidiphilus margaritifer]|uniref:glycosyltransferase family 4 protein n=1 Tax=Tepidiphilus margaritifer TaxID=203471 RepID=UPI0004169FCA|nr:glycosyltransferase family 4 protein [Tepidiphilus margaritifer]
MRLLFLVNAAEFFVSHRLPLGVAAREAGFEVHVATAAGAAVEKIIAAGLTHHELPFSRSGTHPWQEIRTLWAIFRLLERIKPDLVHLVTIKPVVYGGLMARLCRVPSMVAAISGLGTLFVAPTRFGGLRWIVEKLYRLALGHANSRVIFQNPDDQTTLLEMKAVKAEQTTLIRGSGVALEDYPYLPEPEGIPVVSFAARLLRDKGVYEFIEAARQLRMRGVKARFWLIGAPDPGNPTSVSAAEIERWRAEGVVEVLGYRNDIAALFARSHVVVLPSYREGMPKVLIEAAACGRAVVTTDRPGCRDAIEPGESGLLVPARDTNALADAIERLIRDPELRRRMGEHGRRLAEREFAIEKIVAAHLAIYRELLEKVSA